MTPHTPGMAPGARQSPDPLAHSVSFPSIPDHELITRIGHGAYGEVWLARSIVGTFRAVKVVYRHTFSDDRPFEREFAGIKKFEPISRTHPGVVAVLHIGRSDRDGCFYYVMELADDQSLGQHFDPVHYVPKTLRSRLKECGRLRAEECVRIGLSLASSLGHLHRHGLVHRDVKPSNVIFVLNVPKLADIGLVTDIGENATSVGTEGYMPPEGPGSPGADLFSLGKLLYEISTGLDRTQFPSLPTRLHEFGDAPLLAQLNEIVLRACDPNPRKRYRSAEELEAALRKTCPLPATRSGTEFATAPTEEKSVAVLPFLNMSADRENEYLSDGITEDLTAALAKVKGLRVAGRTSAFAFKGKAKDLRKIAAQLGVRTILEGSVRKSGNQLRVTAQLVNAADGCYLWSERYDRNMQEVFALQDEISRAIVAALKVRLIDDDRHLSLARGHTVSTQAYQLYLQGRFYWSLRGANLRKAMHYFELALLEDPQYALAYAGLSDSYNLLGFYAYLSPKEAFPQARAAAEKAMALDETLAEAHNSLGFSDLMFNWDWRKAVKELRRALEIDPTYSPAHYWLASFFSAAGAHQEAIAEDLRALEIDPLSAIVRAHLGWTYLHARQYEPAMESLRAALAIDPGFVLAHWALGRAYAAQSKFDLAILEFEKLLGNSPLTTWGIAWLGYSHAAVGHPQRALEALTQLRQISSHTYVRAYWFALLNLALGRIDDTFACLQQCIEERDAWIGWIRCDPAFDALQSDPRFLRVRRETGLE